MSNTSIKMTLWRSSNDLSRFDSISFNGIPEAVALTPSKNLFQVTKVKRKKGSHEQKRPTLWGQEGNAMKVTFHLFSQSFAVWFVKLFTNSRKQILYGIKIFHI